MKSVDQDVSPLHGFRGEPRTAASVLPRSLSIAISRETGSRGGSIAGRVGVRLGWQVYTQEMLDVFANDSSMREEIFDELPESAPAWLESRLEQLLREQTVSRNPLMLDLARVLLTLGAQGEVVLLGRGAGCVLPEESTLHVRLVAPLADRVAYTSQHLRLTEEEAADQVRKSDHRRSDFMNTHFHRRPSDVHQYDLVLNTSLLGEEACVDLIIQAAKSKANAIREPNEDSA